MISHTATLCVCVCVCIYACSYGDTLVLVGSQALRERALIPGDKDPCFDITHTQYCLLEMVGRARHFGLLRTAVSNQYMKIDARSTFHHVKILEQSGLINVKVRVGLVLIHSPSPSFPFISLSSSLSYMHFYSGIGLRLVQPV